MVNSKIELVVAKCGANSLIFLFNADGIYLEGHGGWITPGGCFVKIEYCFLECIASRMCLFAHFKRDIININLLVV
mgnify:CR=1 FL=1